MKLRLLLTSLLLTFSSLTWAAPRYQLVCTHVDTQREVKIQYSTQAVLGRSTGSGRLSISKPNTAIKSYLSDKATVVLNNGIPEEVLFQVDKKQFVYILLNKETMQAEGTKTTADGSLLSNLSGLFQLQDTPVKCVFDIDHSRGGFTGSN